MLLPGTHVIRGALAVAAILHLGLLPVAAQSEDLRTLVERARAAHTDGDLDQAQVLMERATAEAERDGVGPVELAEALNGLGVILRARGEYEQAAVQLVRSRQILIDRFGPSNRALLPPLNNLAAVYRELGDLDGAERILRESLAIADEAHGPRSKQSIVVEIRLGSVLTQAGRPEAGVVFFEQALESLDSARFDADELLRQVHDELIAAYEAAGKTGKAAEIRARARAREKAPEPDVDSREIAAQINRGLIQMRAGEFEQAKRSLSAGLERLRKILPPTHPQVGAAHYGLARIEVGLEDFAAAEEQFSRALSISEAALPAGHPQRVHCIKGYVALLRQLGRDDEAAELEDRARTVGDLTP